MTGDVIHVSGKPHVVTDERLVAYERSRVVEGKVVHYIQRFVETVVRPADG